MKKEPRRSPGPLRRWRSASRRSWARVQQAGHNQAGRVGALGEYLALARAHEGEAWLDAGAWSEDLAGSYLALRRVDDAVRAISDATRGGRAEGAEMLCELAEKLMRSGHEPQARLLWQQARDDYPRRRLDLCAGWHRYGGIGGHAAALEWLTTWAGAGVAHR
jgi:hypothetical protein